MGDVMMSIEGVIVAAGLSQRTGTYKMTLKIDDTTVIEKCLEGMYDLCSWIIVVGGYKFENLIPVLDQYEKVELVLNANYKDGMFSSVKEGLRQVRGERFFFIPGDYPVVSKQVYETMANVEGDIIIPAYHGENGHPVLINGYLANELVEDTICTSLREFINARGFTLVNVQNPGILQDIDTMDDYEKIVKWVKVHAGSIVPGE